MAGFLAHRPRWTVRLRLTLLFASLVLVSAGAVAGSTYVLFDHWWSGGGKVAGPVQRIVSVPGTASGAAIERQLAPRPQWNQTVAKKAIAELWPNGISKDLVNGQIEQRVGEQLKRLSAPPTAGRK